jgi:hypothetical protein
MSGVLMGIMTFVLCAEVAWVLREVGYDKGGMEINEVHHDKGSSKGKKGVSDFVVVSEVVQLEPEKEQRGPNKIDREPGRGPGLRQGRCGEETGMAGVLGVYGPSQSG